MLSAPRVRGKGEHRISECVEPNNQNKTGTHCLKQDLKQLDLDADEDRHAVVPASLPLRSSGAVCCGVWYQLL